VPNPKLRSEEHSIDARTANALRNKERQLIQSTQRTDFYADGLGTRASLNSDDLLEKKVRFETNGQINDNMVMFKYFLKRRIVKFFSFSMLFYALIEDVNITFILICQYNLKVCI
jgi:hypothetical protein